MGEKLKLVSAARILVRPGPAIQFGVDATTSGVIDSIAAPQVGAVVDALQSARSVVNREELIAKLSLAGLTQPAARTFVDELESFGILRAVPNTPPAVAVIGRSALANALSELLRGSGIIVRRPLRGESIEHFLRFLQKETPLVAVDKLAHARVLGPAVRNGRRELFLPVQLVDGKGIIGPVASHSDGPCPVCFQLHRTDIDSSWPHLLTQLPVGAAGAPPTVAATAAQAAAVVASFVGMSDPALGAVQAQWTAGTMLEVDPFTESRKVLIGKHSGCPLCFEAEGRQVTRNKPIAAASC
ncbi:hypothetical protein [Corynebacterium sp. H130]|uniref:hypothetical protein n=1 Tax=Corynebacterium sp. H130 TaxID=3133444 RepID=UPI003097C1B5